MEQSMFTELLMVEGIMERSFDAGKHGTKSLHL